jgi:hypothetical protein
MSISTKIKRRVILMDEMEFQELLENLIFEGDQSLSEDNDELNIKRILTFEASGLLTGNKGLVVKMNDGSEFQLTIVKSR